MTRYACNGPGCPVRKPVAADAADAPPTCYTCGRPMAMYWEDVPQRAIRTAHLSLEPRPEHPAMARMRGAMLDWVMRVRALDIGEETRTAILFRAKHPADRPGEYLDDRPSSRGRAVSYFSSEISRIHASIRLASAKCQPDYTRRLLLGLDDL
jgi:hypothetical protein